MNAAICKELERFNTDPFQKKDGSRYSIFIKKNLPFLQPLPKYPYEFTQWKTATVQSNYHIAVDFQTTQSNMSMYVRKWMSDTPRSALKSTTRRTVFAATNIFMDAVDSIPQSQSIYLSTISCTANGIRQDSSNGHPVSAKQPIR